MPDFKSSFPVWRGATSVTEPGGGWDKVLPEMESTGLELIKKLLIVDPEKRISGTFLVSRAFAQLFLSFLNRITDGRIVDGSFRFAQPK
jgi:hypothetical protein